MFYNAWRTLHNVCERFAKCFCDILQLNVLVAVLAIERKNKSYDIN